MPILYFIFKFFKSFLIKTFPSITPDGRADCEAGQRGYLERNARFYDKKFKIEQDARTPGAQGPTFKGRDRVPAGQTYTAIPETGPYSQIAPSTSGER